MVVTGTGDRVSPVRKSATGRDPYEIRRAEISADSGPVAPGPHRASRRGKGSRAAPPPQHGQC